VSTVSESGLTPWLHTGEGTLAQYRGVTMLVGPGDELVTGQLLAAARAAAGAEQPDHQLRQIAARLVAANGSAPALCAVGEVAGGVAALVHGAARVTVRTDLGALSLAGCPHQAVVDGFLAGRIRAVEAELGDVEPVELPFVEPETVEVVTGPPIAEPAALDSAERPAAAADIDEMPTVADVVAAVADVVAAVEEALAGSPAERSVVIEPVTEQPVVIAAVAEVSPATGEMRTEVAAINGVRCRKGHFNDPSLAYCVVCGIGMTQAGRVSAQDERPVLGVLLLDDGRLLPLDRDHVLGRSPEVSDQVRRGEATAVALEDPLVSDVHAWVSLRGWEVSVADVGSQHGTYVRDPGASDWEPLVGGGRRTLQPGALIAIGARQLRFETYRK
jgi:hypothetical protein